MLTRAAAPARATRTRRRRALVYLAAAAIVATLGAAGFLAADVYMHWRVQNDAGFNVWGYRGNVVGRKKPGETRVIVLGGSTAFGYGLPARESWPYYLEQKLRVGHRVKGPVSVVNLGIPTDSARTFVATLDDYEYLRGDIALFYEGYNDLGLDLSPPRNGINPAVSHYMAWRHQSPIFRWTGYFPILPLVLSEKAALLTKGPDASKEVVFRPDLARRTTAAALKSAAVVSMALERRLGQLTDVGVRRSQQVDQDCGRWSVYCGAIEDAVTRALAQGQRVVVITQPYYSDLHVEQQNALAGMMAKRFGQDDRVRYVNLGRFLNLRDPAIAYDGIHLVAAANARVAEELISVVVDLLRTS